MHLRGPDGPVISARRLAALALCLAGPFAAPLAAQGRHVVHGTVFDSVARAPLAGAVVQLATLEGASRPVVDTTDEHGRFRLEGLHPGRYVLGFYHESLDALGLDAPVRAVTLAADTLVRADLGIPSGVVVRALRCGIDTAWSGSGMLAGLVRDANSRATLEGATVIVQWMALVLDADNYRNERQQAAATVGAGGVYHGCDLPSDAPLDVYVTAPGHRTIAAHVEVPAGGVARLDLSLADSAAEHGPAIITGRVLRPNGKPVAFGRALLTALGREVPLQDGTFVLADLPLGSWEVEARVIGAEPQTMLVHATESGAVSTTITVSGDAQRLSTVTVMGRRDRNVRTLNEILDRQGSSFGTAFLPGNADLKSATRLTDVMRYARGFKYRSSTEIFGRDLPRGPCRNVAVYVNGQIFAEGIASLDAAVPVQDVLAMETYPDALYAPVQWRTNMGMDPSVDEGGRMRRELGPRGGGVCAVIVVWTKH